MAKIEKAKLSHPDIVWRGRIIKQWYESARTVAMKTESYYGNDGRPRTSHVSVTVHYKGGEAVSYTANISFGPLTTGDYFSAPSAVEALEAAAEQIRLWAQDLQTF